MVAGLTAGCFQPLYGERGVGGPAVQSALASVDVMQIVAPPGTPQARLAVELRNELTYLLTGGGAMVSPTHRLEIAIAVTSTTIIVDPTTARPEYEIVGVDATYKLTELASAKVVVTGTAVHRVPTDIPGQQQRFQAARGQRTAQANATRVVAEQIRTRLAAYFVAGT